jgi:hypothetical protein
MTGIFGRKRRDDRPENYMTISFITVCFSSNIRVMRQRLLGWAGHETCVDEIKNTYPLLDGKYKGVRHQVDLEVEGI